MTVEIDFKLRRTIRDGIGETRVSSGVSIAAVCKPFNWDAMPQSESMRPKKTNDLKNGPKEGSTLLTYLGLVYAAVCRHPHHPPRQR